MIYNFQKLLSGWVWGSLNFHSTTLVVTVNHLCQQSSEMFEDLLRATKCKGKFIGLALIQLCFTNHSL